MDWEKAKLELRKKLDPAHVKDPPKGKYGNYIEGWHAIAEANRIFGEDGWSYEVPSLSQTNASMSGDMHKVGYMATVRVKVGDVYRMDTGHGQGHSRSEGDAHDSASKEAVTDALKRALRTFGNPFGLALYDKSHANVGETATDAEISAAIDQIEKTPDPQASREYYTNLYRNARHVAEHEEVIAAKDKSKRELEALT